MRHLFIPDTQVKPGNRINHIEAAGRYIRDKRPERIIVAGDWWDLPSLSSYTPRLRLEGRRLVDDIEAGEAALDCFTRPWRNLRSYKPDLHFLYGNHENRVHRYINDRPELEDSLVTPAEISLEYGFKVHPFLTPVRLDGILYSHYFPRAASGRIMQNKRGAPSAKAQVDREQMSCTSGHMQGFDYCPKPVGHGRTHHGLIAGSFYRHDEEYITPDGNHHWRGIIMKHQVRDGDYDICPVRIDYLEEKYG